MNLLSRVAKVITKIADIGGHICGWLVVVMMLLVAMEVFMRYVLHQPPIIADEFSGYILVAISFIGIAYTWKLKGHVRIGTLLTIVSKPISNWLNFLALVLAFIFSLILTWGSYSYLSYSFGVGMRSSTWTRFPLQIPQMALPIGFAILSLLILVNLIQATVAIKAGRDIEEEMG